MTQCTCPVNVVYKQNQNEKKLLLAQRMQNHLGDRAASSDWWGRSNMVDVELCDMAEVVVVVWQVLAVEWQIYH